MLDFIILAIVALTMFAAVFYIVRAKKKGAKCIGCPASGCCGSHSSAHSGCCGCHSDSHSH